MEKNNLLIVGFSLNRQYLHNWYKTELKVYGNIYIIFPYIHLWKGNLLLLLKIKYKEAVYILKILIKSVLKNNYREAINLIKSVDNDEKWVKPGQGIYKMLGKNVIIVSPKLKLDISQLIKSFKKTIDLSKKIKKNSFKFDIYGIDASGYLLDSLQRFIPGFKIYNILSPISFIGTWIYLYNIMMYVKWLGKFSNEVSITSVLVNHQVYMESGYISAYLHEINKCKIYHLSVKHQFPVSVKPRQKWFKDKLNRKLQSSIELIENKAFINKDIWNENYSLSNLNDLRAKKINKKKIVIVMHCFTDANALHNENNVIYNSYYQWVRHTLSIATIEANKDIEYIFRIHPASFHTYKGDRQIIRELFRKYKKEKNIKLEFPSHSADHFKNNSIPIFITAKGNFSQELAIAGIKCITLDETSAPNELCERIYNIDNYIKWLSGDGDENKLYLNDNECRIAALNKQIYADINNML